MDDVPEAPGDWRVDHDLCMACGAPPLQAPELMGFGNNHADPAYVQCYFKRQPQTPAEHDQAFRAANVSCCGAVRYCGDDPVLVERMQGPDASTVGPVPRGVMRDAVEKRTSARRMLLPFLLAYALIALLWFLWELF